MKTDETGGVDRFIASHVFQPETINKYRRVLMRLGETYSDLSGKDAAMFQTWLHGQGWGNSMQWVAYSAIKKYLRWQYGDDHPALSLPFKRRKSPPQRALTDAQLEKLLMSFDTSTPKGRRDLAMCSLFVDSGLRVSELCRLELRTLDLETRSLWVVVKGGEWEKGVYSDITAAYIATWFADRQTIAKPGVKAVFVSIGGNTPGRSMTREGVQTIVKAWGRKSGLGMLSPHDFRRTGATSMIRSGAPRKAVKKAFRWKTDAMLDHYTDTIQAEEVEPWFPVKRVMDG